MRCAHLWRWAVGLPGEVDDSFEARKRSEWSPWFERLMRNRLLVGSYRYGRLGQACKPCYDRVEAIIARAERYRETGNLDLLVDVANLALLEAVDGRHPSRHLSAASHTDTVRICATGGRETGMSERLPTWAHTEPSGNLGGMWAGLWPSKGDAR